MAKYPHIKAASLTLRILKFIGESPAGATAAEVEQNFDLPYPTIMAHLAGIEDEGFIERQGDVFVVGFLLSKFWAKRKALNESRRKEIEKEDKILG